MVMSPAAPTLILLAGGGLCFLGAPRSRRRLRAVLGESSAHRGGTGGGGAGAPASVGSLARAAVTALVRALRAVVRPPDPQADRWPELIQQMAALMAAGTDGRRMWLLLAEHHPAPAPEAGARGGMGLRGEKGARGEATRGSQTSPGEPGTAARDVSALVHAAAARARLGLDPLPAVREQPLSLGVSRAARRNLAAAWEVSRRTGAPLAEVLRRLAEATEADQDAQAARETALAGPRATGRILAALPLLGLGLGMVMGTDPLGVLTGQTWGQAALVCGVGLAVAGLLWTRRLIRIAEGEQP